MSATERPSMASALRVGALEAGGVADSDRAEEELRPALISLECSFETGDLHDLELSLEHGSPERVARVFEGTPELLELGVLRTCHRFECVGWSSEGERARSALASLFGPSGNVRIRHGREAVRHLFRVAAGLESTAVGEREVRLQVATAARRILGRTPRPILRPLFEGAVAAAAESDALVPPDRSIAALAVDFVRSRVDSPNPRILIVGTGVVGWAVARQLAGWAEVTVVYRSRPPDPRAAAGTGISAVSFERFPAELPRADVVITAAKAGGRLLGPSELVARRPGVLLLDLGLPRNIDPAVGEHPTVRLVDLAGLRAQAKSSALPAFERAIDRAADRAADALAREAFEAVIDRFRAECEAIRRELLREAPAGGERAAEERDRLTRRLVDRILRTPTAALRAIPPGPEGDALRRWAAARLLRTPPRS
jgi:glutamyl-tRNA reductase